MFIPVNSFMALMVFLSTEAKPLSRAEMNEFWDSCSLLEKHMFMCADLGDRPLLKMNTENWCADLPPHHHTEKGLVPTDVAIFDPPIDAPYPVIAF